MKVKDVLVIGAGIAGCAAALALAKKGIRVTLVTSSLDQRLYYSSFIRSEELENSVKSFQQGVLERRNCSRAAMQVETLAHKSIDDLLGVHYLVDRNGNIDIHRCLQEQLKDHDHVEWIRNHHLLELLTFHQHSSAPSDNYKKPTCFGARLYNKETSQVESFFAKETILATGGAASLFPYSAHPSMVRGEGLAIAHRAGARLINLSQIEFHPLGFFEDHHKPCFPLPLEFLELGGRLFAGKSSEPEEIILDQDLNEQIYDSLLKHSLEYLWLDLNAANVTELKERFPTVDQHCLNLGYNIAKDRLPIVPTARFMCGGVAVDKVGQTNLQRLRAIGEISCTGLFDGRSDESMRALESLTWAYSMAEDISKHIDKFVYYFPEIKNPLPIQMQAENQTFLLEDWMVLQELMWYYVGIKRDPNRVKRAKALLIQLAELNRWDIFGDSNIETIHLSLAIESARLIAQATLETCTSDLVDENLKKRSLKYL